MHRFVLRPALLATCFAMAAGCGDSSESAPHTHSHEPEAIELRFEARVGAEPFDCARTYSGLGTADATAEPLDFRFYVHDVRLVSSDGSEATVDLDQDGKWQHQSLALLDFEDKTGTCLNGTEATNTSIRGMVAPGAYQAIRFKVGVPAELNHADSSTAPSPLNLSSLFWSWTSGYKFLRVDFRLIDEAAATQPVFHLHVGSMACSGDAAPSCERANVAEIELPFDRERDTIVVDYAALVADLDLMAAKGGGCMSVPGDPDCDALFRNLGMDPATGSHLPDQAFFRIE